MNNLQLEQQMLAGDVRSLSRLISLAENLDPDIWRLLAKHYSRLGQARVVGITGPPGAGKSSLLSLLVEQIRSHSGQKVGVLAVDPMSTLSHGALLGDRIRLSQHFNDPQVFIRSVSTRGRLGGLSLATREAIHLMDLGGFDWVFVETVGVGQSEVDVNHICDLTLLVLVPESGDDIQTLKSGVMEIADIYVVHKSDRARANELVAALNDMVALSQKGTPIVISTRKDDPSTVAALLATIRQRLTDMTSLKHRRLERSSGEQRELIENWVLRRTRQQLSSINLDSSNPYQAALDFVRSWRSPGTQR